jgi:RsiW-degrading membrane proteinase PrsW (M82 family)
VAGFPGQSYPPYPQPLRVARPPALRPRPGKGLIVGLVISGICVTAMLALFLAQGGAVGFGVAVALALAPVPVVLAAILALDRLEPEPPLNLWFTFGWGAGIAVVVAIVLSLLGEGVVAVGFGDATADTVGTVVLAPIVEEAVKGAALLWLLWRRRTEFDGLTDGIVYGAMAGLGFAVVENVGYYLGAFGDEGTKGAVMLFVIRGVIAPLGHPIYTAMTGLGVAYAATRTGGARFLAIPAGYVVAVFLHGLWNGMATFGGLPGLGFADLVIMLAMIVLIAVAVRERRRLVALMAHYLPAYLPTGLVTPQDIVMLGSLKTRKQARAWARTIRAQTAMADYQQAATELILLHQRAEREGADPYGFAAQRDALLAMMAGARRAFIR